MIQRKSDGLYFAEKFTDQIVVYICWLISYFFRFETNLPIEVGQGGLFNWYLKYGLLLVILSTYFFKNSKLYKNRNVESLQKQIITQVKANTISLVFFVVFAFFLSQHRVSRVVLISYFVISTLTLIGNKIIFRKLGRNRKTNVLLIGSGKAAKDYFDKVKKLKNFTIHSWFDGPEDFAGNRITSLPNKFPEKEGIDIVVIGYDNSESSKLDNALTKFNEEVMPVIILPDIQNSILGFEVQDFQGTPMIVFNEPKFNSINLFLKRVLDVCACGLGILLISPILAVVAMLVKFTSKGPIFYGQVRMGIDGRQFKMWKFRSMVIDSSNKGTWTVANDPRVTTVGNILRKTSLDELPQLWNVIVGDMSLVGPRPERPMYVDQFRTEIPAYMLRHKMKAGITGWAQVNGWRGDTSIEKRIECDLWYIKNWSLWLDISIIFMTFWKGFVNKNAY